MLPIAWGRRQFTLDWNQASRIDWNTASAAIVVPIAIAISGAISQGPLRAAPGGRANPSSAGT